MPLIFYNYSWPVQCGMDPFQGATMGQQCVRALFRAAVTVALPV